MKVIRADNTYNNQTLEEWLRLQGVSYTIQVVMKAEGTPVFVPVKIRWVVERAIAWLGRFLVVGFAAGAIPKIPLNLALLKGCDIKGVFWGSFVERDRKAHQANMAQIFAWTMERKLSAHAHAVFRLAGTAAALGVLSRREARGKVLVRV